MDKDALKEQLQENKKKLVLLGAVCLFGVYMMWPSGGEPAEEEGSDELNAQLAALQAERDAVGLTPAAVFDGTDQRGISVGGGTSVDDPGAFQTDSPIVLGILVGFGTKTDLSGEYLVAYVSVPDTPGYEVDMRGMTGYNLNVPEYLEEGANVRVYGDFDDTYRVEATAIQ